MLIVQIFSACVFIFSILFIYSYELFLITKFIANQINIQEFIFKNNFNILIHILALIGIVCFIYGFFIEPYWIELNTVNVRTNQLKNTSLKIVQISDLHCENVIKNEKKVIDMVNSKNPDLIFFTGDSINNKHSLKIFKYTLSNLNANIGKYAVLGNNDNDYYVDFFSNTGFKNLDYEYIKLSKNNETFFVSGINFRKKHVMPNLLLNQIPSNKYNIFLYHTPDLIKDIKNFKVDMYLSGHTHGGQIRLPFYGALITQSKHGKKYEAGKFLVNDTLLYVNKGIGMSDGFTPKARFLARPEITVFNIKPSK